MACNTYNYRKGSRSDKQFKTDMKSRTKNERLAADSLIENWLEKESPGCYLEDYGCGNDGEVLYEGVNQDEDFILKNYKGKDYLLEMKVSPAPCVTLKEDIVNKLVKQSGRDDVWVDWVVNFGKPNETHYIMSPAVSLEMFRKHGHYAVYYDGFKCGWRLFQDKIESLLSKYEIVMKLTKGE